MAYNYYNHGRKVGTVKSDKEVAREGGSVLVFVLLIFFLSSCSDDLSFKTLYVSQLFEDVPSQYNLPTKFSDCKLTVETLCQYDSKDYLRKMGVESQNENMLAFLCPPDIDSAYVTVFDNQGDKLLGMSVSNGQMNALKMWKYGNLIYESEGLYRPVSDFMGERTIAYSWVAGKQKIYGDHLYENRCVLEKQCNFTEGCNEFRLYEKTFYENNGKPYYKIVEKLYTGGAGTTELYADSYYSVKPLMRKYQNERQEDMDIKDVLFLENQPYLIFESNFVEDGLRWYMVLFPGTIDGAFFALEIGNTRKIMKGPAFNFFFLNKKSKSGDCSMRLINNWSPKNLCGIYHSAMSDLSEISFSNPTILFENYERFQTIVFKECDLCGIDWMIETLKKHIDDEWHSEIERNSRYNSHLQDDSIEIKLVCTNCNGTGHEYVYGMGIPLGTMPCMACNGLGFIREYVHIDK